MHKHTLIHTASALGIALPLSLAASLPAAAQSQLIDNFQSGGALLTQNAPHNAAGFVTDASVASVPGGWRDIAMRSPGGSAYSFYMVTTTSFQINRFDAPTIYASLAYGQHTPMNLNIGGQSALFLDMIFAGGAVNSTELPTSNIALTVYAYTSNGAGLDPDGSATSITLPKFDLVTLPFSSFAMNSATGRPVNWSDVDSLLFVFNEIEPTQANYMVTALRSISAVPEPSSWLLMLIGGVALAARGTVWGKSARVLSR